jgi:hypothetical protein
VNTGPPRTRLGVLVDVTILALIGAFVILGKLDVFLALSFMATVQSGRLSGLTARYLSRKGRDSSPTSSPPLGGAGPTLLTLLVVGSGFLSFVVGFFLIPRYLAGVLRG